ncbi:MAG: hypothetical protein ACI3XA_03485 [Clostridia bacterium]
MQLQSNYIFLKNPYKKPTKQKKNSDENVIVLDLGKSVYGFIRNTFPDVTGGRNPDNPFKRECSLTVKVGSVDCTATFIINEVRENTFLDIIVDGKSKTQAIKCFEYIQTQLLTSGIDEHYIPIISYDAISEYYCNKIFGKLNSLERNLRKLLYNIYIVNFGVQYYQATISKELQDEIKKNIQAKGGAEKKEIERLQNFFYSLDYGSLQKMLFTPSWTDIDQEEKDKFLSENTDLSILSDEELRNKFLKFTPKSDWERFFSEKIKIENIEQLVKDIGLFRNKVAHFKFFSKKDYDECAKAVNFFNKAVLNAIKITESKDFAEKNTVHLKSTLKDFAEKMENVRKTIMKSYEPLLNNISKVMQTYSWIDKNSAIMETARRTQSIFEAIKPTLPVLPTSLVQGLDFASKVNIPQINMPQFDFSIPHIPDEIVDYSKDVADDEDITEENKITPESEEDDNA